MGWPSTSGWGRAPTVRYRWLATGVHPSRLADGLRARPATPMAAHWSPASSGAAARSDCRRNLSVTAPRIWPWWLVGMATPAWCVGGGPPPARAGRRRRHVLAGLRCACSVSRWAGRSPTTRRWANRPAAAVQPAGPAAAARRLVDPVRAHAVGTLPGPAGGARQPCSPHWPVCRVALPQRNGHWVALLLPIHAKG